MQHPGVNLMQYACAAIIVTCNKDGCIKVSIRGQLGAFWLQVNKQRASLQAVLVAVQLMRSVHTCLQHRCTNGMLALRWFA